jgi:hypothetical protein
MTSGQEALRPDNFQFKRTREFLHHNGISLASTGADCMRIDVLALAAVAMMTCTREARAFCRATACATPIGFSPSPDQCYPDNFAQSCASQMPPAKPLPLFWRTGCVSYDIQQNASRQVPYARAAQLAAGALAKWTSTSCQAGADLGPVSVSVRDLGPVECAEVQYNPQGGNQHVILFHDDVWPHNDPNNTLGLTTITFDAKTGEIYDADIEINATVPLSIADPVAPDGYDLESILTHEAGHFLGLAHSGDAAATMYAHYTRGSTTMRVLTPDDADGICAVYPPGGLRSVDPSVADGGIVAQRPCDPTPRHGFQSQCAQTKTYVGCTQAPSGPAGDRAPLGLLAALGAIIAKRRSNRGVSRATASIGDR